MEIESINSVKKLIRTYDDNIITEINKLNIESNTKNHINNIVNQLSTLSESLVDFCITLSERKDAEQEEYNKSCELATKKLKETIENCEAKVEKLQMHGKEIGDVGSRENEQLAEENEYLKTRIKELQHTNQEQEKKIKQILEEQSENKSSGIGKGCEDIEQKFNRLKKQYDEIKQKCENAKGDIENCDIHVGHINKIKAEIDKLGEQNDELLKILEQLRSENIEFSQTNKMLHDKNKSVEKSLSDTIDELSELREQSTRFIEKQEETKSQILQKDLKLTERNIHCKRLEEAVLLHMEKNAKLEKELLEVNEKLKESIKKSQNVIQNSRNILHIK
jgi:DNA repair exonuclease SbcCD ATPase subunit